MGLITTSLSVRGRKIKNSEIVGDRTKKAKETHKKAP